jgi:hypothetical protein
MSYPSHIRTAVQQVIEAREGAPIDQVLARLYGEGMTQKAATGFVSRNRRRFAQIDWRAAMETDGNWSVYGCRKV